MADEASLGLPEFPKFRRSSVSPNGILLKRRRRSSGTDELESLPNKRRMWSLRRRGERVPSLAVQYRDEQRRALRSYAFKAESFQLIETFGNSIFLISSGINDR